MKHLITLLLACFTATAFAITDYKAGDELYVHAPSGLKLRNTPDGETVLTTIPYGTKLKALENRGTVAPKTVDGLKGFWAKVTYDGKTGYLFDGYLSMLPTPKPGCTSLLQYCKDNFTTTTEMLITSFNDTDGDDMSESSTQLFKFNGKTVTYAKNEGYEWTDESIVFTGFTNEDAYLVARGIYSKTFAENAEYYKKNKAPADISYNTACYTSYVEYPNKQYFYAPLSLDGCTEDIYINSRSDKKLTCIKYLGYC